ncbi:transcription factor [Cladophialophora psammophila CBS 110553]|uniref:Multiprotein-bridging factor 1 n=1 Tax=Cladophialophora psammophila CBS 110553 TaxID=1182543 RepID=W9X117_9EURO|nr:transcription factor [Cladophialophora psammophila CBS 110553]EXJ73848.1 transcription factor [Cladophialophora psammophila CBS 110553]
MADSDWDTVTRIGSKARGPGSGGVDRERVVKGNAALNAAKRSGAVVLTEKKYGGTNSKSGAEGQHLTKVDRSDDIIKPKTIPLAASRAIPEWRKQNKGPDGKAMTQEELARRANVNATLLRDIESGRAAYDKVALEKLQKFMRIHLTGGDIGSPMGPKFKRQQQS